ncbi:MAG: (2Fe-2S)-binding protein [Alphaproteobacteria bacterium]|jgi:2-furoyl-CoA dehydrogenase 2Fe-2S iron sulfur subunit
MFRADKSEKIRITLTVNRRDHVGFATPRTLLSDFLRHELGLFGTHVGCEHGVCGACTILIDGRAERGCLTLAVQAMGRAITTVEGLGDGGDGENLSPLQAAFSRHGGLQCGYCTPGILASTTQFLAEVSNPTEAEVRDMLSGHICRCTGYDGMVRAILDVAGG